jgi:hypothetical protein
MGLRCSSIASCRLVQKRAEQRRVVSSLWLGGWSHCVLAWFGTPLGLQVFRTGIEQKAIMNQDFHYVFMT